MQPAITKAADALMLRTRDIPDKAPWAGLLDIGILLV
jgi:hypothetical protein